MSVKPNWREFALKRTIAFSLFAVMLICILPVGLSAFVPHGQADEIPEPTASEIIEEKEEEKEEKREAISVSDADIKILVYSDGETREMTMAQYLPLALAGEMPAAFESEALKAQATALRTYILYCGEHRSKAHPDAFVCTDSQCCTAAKSLGQLREDWGARFDEYFAKIDAAVRETDGQYLVYEGDAILAAFHSCSAGKTESSENVWSSSAAYLVSVSSPETVNDAANLFTVAEVSVTDFADTVKEYFPAAQLDASPDSWLGATTLNGTGRVASMQIGSVSISGTQLRAMFSLRSTDFSLSFEEDKFVFRVGGYGHGVGMSQHGANAMAKTGCNYMEILAHYYPGTELVVSVTYM